MKIVLSVMMRTPPSLSLTSSVLGSACCPWVMLLSLSWEMPWLPLMTSPVRYVLAGPLWELTVSFSQEAEYAEMPEAEALPVTTLVKAEVLDCLAGQLDLEPEVQILLFLTEFLMWLLLLR